ncbi:MAG: DNA polymerase III subunit chi [Zoogloeaceae bacterium]|nr:DNA polymerase III subunit chi [Zoogloeaceae bacterium]
MTEIHFYHNAPDRLAAACRIAQRACGAGRRLAVRIPDTTLARRFDQLLWTFDQLAFVPHVMADSPLAPETPIVIGHAEANWPHHDVLLNLGNDLPAEHAAFSMLMEVVGPDDTDRAAARERWRSYKSAGFEPIPHDLAKRGSE